MRKFLTFIYIIILIIIIYFFQVFIVDNRTLFGIKPNLILISCIVVSLWYGLQIGATYSFLIGVLTDILFGNTMGLFTVSYVITGSIIGYFHSNYRKENKMSLVYVTIISTAIFETIGYISYLLTTSIYHSFFYLLKQIVISSILNIAIVYIIFSLVVKITEYFEGRMRNNDIF